MKGIGLIRAIRGLSVEKRDVHARLLTDVNPSLHVITDEMERFQQEIHYLELARRAIPVILKVAETLFPQADTLALACTDFSTVGTAAFSRQQLNTLVLNPVLVIGAILRASL